MSHQKVDSTESRRVSVRKAACAGWYNTCGGESGSGSKAATGTWADYAAALQRAEFGCLDISYIRSWSATVSR